MGFLGIKTNRDREHELNKQREHDEAEAKKAAAELASQERQQAKRENEQTRREKARLDSAERESEANRRSEERKIQIKTDAEIEQTQIEADTQKALAQMENERTIAKYNAQVAINAKDREEQTECTRIEEEENTKRIEINANRDIEIANKKMQIKYEALSTMKDMFTSYLNVVSESHKAEIEALIALNETRKVKYLASLEKAQARHEKLLDLSKEAKGQEKLNYLNESRELEKTIRDLQTADKEADEDLTGTLAMLRDKQKHDMEQGQTKLTNMDSLFIDYKGDEQQ